MLLTNSGKPTNCYYGKADSILYMLSNRSSKLRKNLRVPPMKVLKNDNWLIIQKPLFNVNWWCLV